MHEQIRRKTTVAYLRVTSNKQVEELSLGSQQAKILEWCSNKGYEMIATFSDEGEAEQGGNEGRRRI